MSIAPSLFSSDETHCCASKRQENICCTHGLFLLLDYQVYTRQHCPGISNTPTQEQLQDTAENMKCNHDQLLPETPPCAGVTSHAGCPTLDGGSFCAIWLWKKFTAKVKTFRPAQHSTPAQRSALAEHRAARAARQAGICSAAMLESVPCGIFHREIAFFSLVLGGKRCPQQLRGLNNSKLSAACRTGLLEVFPLPSL